jgi:hypothetical protein
MRTISEPEKTKVIVSGPDDTSALGTRTNMSLIEEGYVSKKV